MPSSPLRVGVIGCGFFAENHLAAWSSMDDVVLAAVCDLDIGKARSAASRHGAGAAYSDAADMLDHQNLDFVDIVTTMESHVKLVGDGGGSQASDDRPEAARANLGRLRLDCRRLHGGQSAIHGA